MRQRELMRQLYAKHGGDVPRVVRAYATAEGRGEVVRTSNTHATHSLSYARALLADGLRRGWLRK